MHCFTTLYVLKNILKMNSKKVSKNFKKMQNIVFIFLYFMQIKCSFIIQKGISFNFSRHAKKFVGNRAAYRTIYISHLLPKFLQSFHLLFPRLFIFSKLEIPYTVFSILYNIYRIDSRV